MNKLLVKHFGPVSEGCQNNDGWLEVTDVTLFIGPTGSGKSTLAKVYATMAWLEKAFYREDLQPGDFQDIETFRKYLRYQNIEQYLATETVLHYQGGAFSIYYNQGSISIEPASGAAYSTPKIMYVPAERNLVSTTISPELFHELPRPLFTFLDRYTSAQKHLKKSLPIPLEGISFSFDETARTAFIEGKGHRVKLQQAASGQQAMAPLYLVSAFLAKTVAHQQEGTEATDKYFNLSGSEVQPLNLKQVEQRREKLRQLLAHELPNSEELRTELARLTPQSHGAFINIVEELEQNLYPEAQMQLLYSLLGLRRLTQGSQLLLTTHSPYLIDCLTLAVKAGTVHQKMNGAEANQALQQQLASIVPAKAQLQPKQVRIYQTHAEGTCSLLPMEHDIPSDDNALNNFLQASNHQFGNLLEIEGQL